MGEKIALICIHVGDVQKLKGINRIIEGAEKSWILTVTLWP